MGKALSLLLDYAISLIKNNQAKQAIFSIDSRRVWVKGKIVHADYPPFLLESRSYVPIRLLAESIGLNVGWDQDTYIATLYNDLLEINIPVGDDYAEKNGVQFSLGGQAVLRNSRTFVPARSVVEALGCRVYWAGLSRQVIVAWK